MRVLHLLESSRFSGAENVICQIIGMFPDEDVEFFYCSRDGQIREALEERNINFIPIKELSVKEVKRVIKEISPDIIHAHDMRASFVAAIAKKSIPLISHIHNNAFNSRGVSLKSIAYLYAGFKANHIFWVSDSSYRGYIFKGFLKSKSEVLYNIIDIDKLYKKMDLDPGMYDFDIVYLGRLSEPKNPIRLLNIFRKIVDFKSDVKIAVIGTGELESEVHSEALKLNLYENVSFLGFQSNPYKMLHDSKVMIMTSKWEGTPMCVLEAMSLGVPVVSTPTDGVSVVVDNGKNGVLSDDDNTIVEACLDLCSDISKRKEFSENAIQNAKQLMDIEKYKERILRAYTII